MSSENPHGPVIRNDGTVRFRLWAPSCERVQIELAGARHAMNPSSAGWHELITAGTGPGSRYCFVLPDGMRVPDPASRYQPEGVHGPSELVHTESWQWDEGGWKGAPWEQYVIYELHIGTFTSEGTFSAAIGRLDHLAALGVTAVELMPVACFPGKRDWGYDGVLPYAPATAYGRPEGLKAFIEAAHRRGLAVVLDVVYNHFGPEGNYLSLYAREFFTRTHKTPWGDAINYDGPGCQPVREFVIHNALYWVEQFHIDALRMDAVDAIKDDGPVHILDELARRVRAASKRTVHLVLENYNNEASWLERHDDGMTPCFYTAQWNDDVHHALHTAVTGERTGITPTTAAIPGNLDVLSRRVFVSGAGNVISRQDAGRAVRASSRRRFRFVSAESRSNRQPGVRRPYFDACSAEGGAGSCSRLSAAAAGAAAVHG